MAKLNDAPDLLNAVLVFAILFFGVALLTTILRWREKKQAKKILPDWERRCNYLLRIYTERLETVLTSKDYQSFSEGTLRLKSIIAGIEKHRLWIPEFKKFKLSYKDSLPSARQLEKILVILSQEKRNNYEDKQKKIKKLTKNHDKN